MIPDQLFEVCVRIVSVFFRHGYMKRLRLNTVSHDKHHYGRLNREDSGGRKREEASTLSLRYGTNDRSFPQSHNKSSAIAQLVCYG